MTHRPAHLESLEPRRLFASTLALAPSPTASAASLVAAAATQYGPAQPAVTFNASPNFGSRGATKIDSIVIHTTEGTYQSAINTFKSTASQVSAHYVVDTNGAITQMV